MDLGKVKPLTLRADCREEEKRMKQDPDAAADAPRPARRSLMAKLHVRILCIS